MKIEKNFTITFLFYFAFIYIYCYLYSCKKVLGIIIRNYNTVKQALTGNVPGQLWFARKTKTLLLTWLLMKKQSEILWKKPHVDLFYSSFKKLRWILGFLTRISQGFMLFLYSVKDADAVCFCLLYILSSWDRRILWEHTPPWLSVPVILMGPLSPGAQEWACHPSQLVGSVTLLADWFRNEHIRGWAYRSRDCQPQELCEGKRKSLPQWLKW